MFRCFSLLLVPIFTISALQADYYWRDYYGEVPSDALPVEPDSPDGNHTYIGQGLVRRYGIFIGQIFPGETELITATWGVRNTSYGVKILCTRHPENFYWLPTNGTRYFEEVEGDAHKHAVVGGHDQAYELEAPIYVGRYKSESVWKVGIIGWGDLMNSHRKVFWYPTRGFQCRSEEFDVLIYNMTVPGVPKDQDVAPASA